MAQEIVVLIAAFGVLLTGLEVQGAHRLRVRNFEALFLTRYWSLMDQLSLEAIRGVPQPSVQPNDERVIRTYLRLCEYQLELHEKRWISRRAWAVWSAGISVQLARWPVSQVWAEVQEENGSGFPLLREHQRRAADPAWHPGGGSYAARAAAGHRDGRGSRRDILRGWHARP